MNAARFLVEVQRQAGRAADVRDPLAVARAFLMTCPTSLEAQILRKLVRALVSGWGHFARDDLKALSQEGTQLAAALIEAHVLDIYTDKQWRSAALSLLPPSP
jgi:hypothetical protein